MKFKVGDKVRIIDRDQTFAIYEDFFDEQKMPKSKFISGELPKNGQLGDIIHIGQHIWVGYGDLCIVRIDEVDYIIEDKGLELVGTKKNLIPQIAKMLGVEIGEEFKYDKGGANKYRFTIEGGLEFINGGGRWQSTQSSMNEIISGKGKIEKLPKKPILTEDEKAILRSLPKEYEWIARDCYKDIICVFHEKPKKGMIGTKVWGTTRDSEKLFVFNHLFKFIKWEDEEPYNIEELLKE